MPGEEMQEAAVYRSADLRAFEFGRFADCVVTCGPKSWNLHRTTLCHRSQWFDKALAGQFKEGCEAVVQIREQDPEAVEACLKYIYGGVAAVDMIDKNSTRPAFKFYAELYRSADFFMLEQLLPVVQRHLADYYDEKMRWMFTQGNTLKDLKEQKARVWVEDLKAAILEAHKWNTPVVNTMLMEFIWAGQAYFTQGWPVPHFDISEFLGSIPGYKAQVFALFQNPVWSTGRKDPNQGALVWTPKPCSGPIPALPRDICARCDENLADSDPRPSAEEKRLSDPFNVPSSKVRTRVWCQECVDAVEYPWRENGYL